MSVYVLRGFEGNHVVGVLRKVVGSTNDAGVRSSAMRGIVAAETNSLIACVKEVVEDDARYSALDRLAVYEELLLRLVQTAGPKRISPREAPAIRRFLKGQVFKEGALGTRIKIDAYLQAVDEDYRSSDSRKGLLMSGTKSNVERHRLYCSEALKAYGK